MCSISLLEGVSVFLYVRGFVGDVMAWVSGYFGCGVGYSSFVIFCGVYGVFGGGGSEFGFVCGPYHFGGRVSSEIIRTFRRSGEQGYLAEGTYHWGVGFESVFHVWFLGVTLGGVFVAGIWSVYFTDVLVGFIDPGCFATVLSGDWAGSTGTNGRASCNGLFFRVLVLHYYFFGFVVWYCDSFRLQLSGREALFGLVVIL